MNISSPFFSSLPGLMDFSHLSLIQTKKQEMDSQVNNEHTLSTFPMISHYAHCIKIGRLLCN